MSEKRRDNRNRILHNGESQRQDGRYAYKDHTPRMPTYLLLQHDKEWNEPENPAVHHGSLGYQRHAEHPHPPDF